MNGCVLLQHLGLTLSVSGPVACVRTKSPVHPVVPEFPNPGLSGFRFVSVWSGVLGLGQEEFGFGLRSESGLDLGTSLSLNSMCLCLCLGVVRVWLSVWSEFGSESGFTVRVGMSGFKRVFPCVDLGRAWGPGTLLGLGMVCVYGLGMAASLL